MGLNWGGFASGINQGLQLGQNINELVKEDKINKLREQGMAEAERQRADSVASMIRENGINTEQQAPPPALALEPVVATGQVAPDNAVAQTAPVQQPVAQTIPAGGQIPPAAAPAPMQMASAPSAPIDPVGALAQPPKASKRFMVGDMGFDTKEQATAQAQKEAPTAMEFFVKQAVPKIQAGYLAQGDPAKAEAWGRYAEDTTSQKNMETWSKAYRSAQAGDIEGAARHVFKLYQNFDDGVTPVSHETVKNKDGHVTGFNVKLKDDASGETRSQFVDKSSLVEMGLSALSPPAMFEQAYKRKVTAENARLADATAEVKDARTLQRTVAVEGIKQGAADRRDDKKIAADVEKTKMQGAQKLEQISVEQNLRNAGLGTAKKVEIQAKIDALRGSGYDDEQINGMMPALLGTGEYKKTTDPAERRALVVTDLLKNDPSFARADADKQAAKVDQVMSTIYGSKPAKGGTANPFEPSAKPAAKPGAKQSGTAIYDPVSKSIVYR